MARVRKEWIEARRRLRDAFDKHRCYVPSSAKEARLLRRHVLEDDVVEPFPQLFADAALWEGLRRNERELQVIRGYALMHPNAVFCSTSAVLLHGLPVSFNQLGIIHLYTNVASPTASTARVARHAVTNPAYTTIDGVKVASIAQAAVESMCASPFADGLAVADGLLRRLDIDRELLGEIVDELSACRKGVATARRVAAYADARAESGGESVARGIMICEGLVPTDLQRMLRDPVDGRGTYYADFVFELRDGKTVIGEFDGKAKYVDPALLGDKITIGTLLDERKRESHITLLGMPVARFTWNDVRTRGRLCQILAAAGVTSETLVPCDYRSRPLAPRWLSRAIS
ncbi:hypothetical protein [Enorma sp.]|uniref:hypothetical protein n=1 Tax=Enorma sp. TaxID=1920692 RepID=UPI0025BF12C0|nr:hypothetical protein [Enorma sp.]